LFRKNYVFLNVNSLDDIKINKVTYTSVEINEGKSIRIKITINIQKVNKMNRLSIINT